MTSTVVVEPVEREGPDFESVLTLWGENRATLGLLPRGGFEDCADVGGLLIARVDGAQGGYLAFRRTRREAVIVHVCVGKSHRGHGIASALLKEAFEITSDLPAVRLSCRKDYEQATRLWQRHGFINVDEREGRGADRAPILVWRRLNEDDEPLLSRAREEDRSERRTVAVDANVFMDLFADTEPAEESKSLLADWLADDIAICVTAELKNEILRNDDVATRSERRRQIRMFDVLEARSDELGRELARVETLLPSASCDSDESDRRQLAHALARGAEFFVTRDTALLKCAHAIEETVGIGVMRPVDLVRRIYGDLDADVYAPVRMGGTTIEGKDVKAEGDLLPFQAFAQSESKATFLGLCRGLLGDPSRVVTRAVGVRGEPPFLAYAVEGAETGHMKLPFFRTIKHPLLATVLRRTLSDLVAAREKEGRSEIECRDIIDPRVISVAKELGFRTRGSVLVKTALHGVLGRDALPEDLRSSVNALEADAIERAYWPLKLRDGGSPSYIVPILPPFAAQLFDAQLAEQELFPADVSLAVALENVYYSGSAVRIPRGARILWYVSGKPPKRVAELRACSLCEDTVRGSAKEIFRSFHRLGVFRWRQVLGAADGDPYGEVTAYRFAFTERFRAPVSWERIQEVLRQHTGHGNQLAGPVRVPDGVFETLYREATSAGG